MRILGFDHAVGTPRGQGIASHFKSISSLASAVAECAGGMPFSRYLRSFSTRRIDRRGLSLQRWRWKRDGSEPSSLRMGYAHHHGATRRLWARKIGPGRRRFESAVESWMLVHAGVAGTRCGPVRSVTHDLTAHLGGDG